MFYRDEYSARTRPIAHMRSAVVPHEFTEQQTHKKRRRSRSPRKSKAAKAGTTTLVSGGTGSPEEEVKLFRLDKTSSWVGPDRDVGRSNSDSARYFTSAYMYLTRCIRKALKGDPKRNLFIMVGGERINSRVVPDERDLAEENKSIVYRNAHYKTLWQHAGVRDMVVKKFLVRAQDTKPNHTTRGKKRKSPPTERVPSKKAKVKRTPRAPRATQKAPKAQTSSTKSTRSMKGAFWTFSRLEHQKIRDYLHAKNQQDAGEGVVKGPSGSEIAKEKGRRWRALTSEEKLEYAA